MGVAKYGNAIITLYCLGEDTGSGEIQCGRCCRQESWKTESCKPFDAKHRDSVFDVYLIWVSVFLWFNVSPQYSPFLPSGLVIYFWNWTEYFLNDAVSINCDPEN